MKCSVQDCNKIMCAKSYCSKHYNQARLHGNPYVSSHDRRPAIVKDGYALIALGVDAKQGYAKVDIEDAILATHNWSKHHTGNAHARIDGKTVTMESLIADKKEGMQIDHINHDRLDNRKANLRVCTKDENRRNAVKAKHNTTGYKGVVASITLGKYRAQIGYKGKKIHIGTFATTEEAAIAYDLKARELFGEFAYLNFNSGIKE